MFLLSSGAIWPISAIMIDIAAPNLGCSRQSKACLTVDDVNAVNPGTADTPWIDRLLSLAPDPAAERAALAARQPHGRLVSPDELAEAVAFLASPRSLSTRGTSLAVDGGMQDLRLRPASGS
jgi:NAD(P)-dependent dehydrogenase (short-subunit alcohol dehydrogenase family)